MKLYGFSGRWSLNFLRGAPRRLGPLLSRGGRAGAEETWTSVLLLHQRRAWSSSSSLLSESSERMLWLTSTQAGSRIQIMKTKFERYAGADII